MSEQNGPQTGQAWEPDAYRVEIKENSKGEPSVSVRATDMDSEEAVGVAVAMYLKTRKELGLE